MAKKEDKLEEQDEASVAVETEAPAEDVHEAVG
jgi:hypothetical protein